MTARRKKRQSKSTLLQVGIIIILLVAVGFMARRLNAAHSSEDESTPIAIDYSSPTLATPTDSLLIAATNPQLPEVVKQYDGMLISFNPKLHIPNWVAWELTADETEGKVPRTNRFANDPDVEGCPDPWDYSYSGYDRGHMAPAGDMKWSAEAMEQTFLLTNICPQAKTLNTGTWKRLEDKCRQWARADSSLIIICGPVLTDSITEFIGDSRVAVPQRFFKVILSPKASRGIGFVMNNGRVEGGMQAASTSIDEVERITGHDFFASLPDSIEQVIESQHDFHKWSTIR